jgi:hypothetical protein
MESVRTYQFLGRSAMIFLKSGAVLELSKTVPEMTFGSALWGFTNAGNKQKRSVNMRILYEFDRCFIESDE